MNIAPVGLEFSGYKPHNCSCIKCKTMCLSSPCFPTPEEVVRLEKMGFGSDLSFTMFMNPSTFEIYSLVAPKVAPKGLLNQCTFHTPDGLCELHELGLKPTEGRLAHHDQPHADTVTLRVSVCELWKTDLAKELLLKYGGSDYLEEVERMRIKVADFLQKELG